MLEQGMAMMGSASASGIDRARLAAEQAIACPLLEGVNLAGARGVLVNITCFGSEPQAARDEGGDEHDPGIRRGGRDDHLRRRIRRRGRR
jgi:hypothetical protein